VHYLFYCHLKFQHARAFGRRLLSCCFLLCFSLVGVSTVAQAPLPNRLAIVIGNASYQQSPLKNPLNDARAVSESLKRYGFEVHSYMDLKSAQAGEIKQLIRDRVAPYTTVIFYYAGHGIQIDGENLFPNVDANFGRLESIRGQSIKLNEVLGAISSVKPKAAVVVLDACRDNPFEKETGQSGNKGLARAVSPPASVIFYATRPGSTASDGSGSNGLFTDVFLREMANPELPLELLFRRVSSAVYKASKGEQEPWVEGVIREEVVLARPEAMPEIAVAAAPPEAPTAPTVPLALATPPVPATATESVVGPAAEVASVATLPPSLPTSAPASAPMVLAQADAMRSLSSLDLKAETLETKFYCEDGSCADYQGLYRVMLEQRKFPELFVPAQKLELCEYDLKTNSCKETFLNHGVGINPMVLFQMMFGSRIVTRGIDIKSLEPTNGGGLTFSIEKKMRIERTKLGSESWIECPDSAGRVEMMSDRLEFELSTAVCLPQSPPVPTAFKLNLDVIAYDHSNRDFYVRWRATQYSFGYYSSSNGFARMSFR
jgi:hypothetical protein